MFIALFPILQLVQGADLHYNRRIDVGTPAENGIKWQKYIPYCKDGEYLNLCAVCVSGQTEKEDNYGTDTCGVCGGLDTCKEQCSDPMSSLEGEIAEDSKGCTKFVSMTPYILDRAASSNGSICIFGDGISPETLKAVKCTLKKEEKDIVEIKGEILDDKVQLVFPLPLTDELSLTASLVCNTSVGLDFRESIHIVNSSNLTPLAVNKTTIETWTTNELSMTVSKIAGPVSMLCFGKDESGDLVYREWIPVSAVSGNSLSSSVTCPRVTVIKPGEMEFGLAYSSQAINSTKTVKVTGVALSPKPGSAVYVPDQSQVIIVFDQNLEENAVKDCSSIFKESSLSIFGKDPVCSVLANEVHVDLTDDSSLADTVLEFKDNVMTKFSEMAVEGSIPITIKRTEKKSKVRVSGLNKVCPVENGEVTTEGANQMEKPEQNKMPGNRTDISPGQIQRRNLLKWRENRSMRASIKAPPSAAGLKEEDMPKVKQAEVVPITGDIWTKIEGPEEIDLRSSAVFSANVKSCAVRTASADRFVWKVTDGKGNPIDTSIQNGPKLRLEADSLQPNEEYKISVQAFEGDKSLGADEVNVRTSLKSLDFQLLESRIVISTGQPLEIDASKYTDINPKLMKFKWTCRTGYCFLPGNERKSLNSLDTFSKPVLRLPPKSLAIGSYQFEVELLTDFGRTKADVNVEVISGQPPHFSRLSSSELDPGRDVEIHLEVSEILGPCMFYWESVPQIGYTYLAINQNQTRVDGSPTSPQSRTLNLRIGRTDLRPGAKYRIRAVADCDRLAQSSFQFDLHLPEIFQDFRLLVDPLKGTSLETKFTYKVESNKSDDSYLYSYGFEDNGVSHLLYSGHEKMFTTILGHGTYKTITKVCRTKTDCLTLYGPEISTAGPSKIDSTQLRQLADIYKDLVLSVSFGEAEAFLEMVVPAIKETGVKEFENFSAEIQKILTERIEEYTKRLENDSSMVDKAVQLLDLSTNALSLLSTDEEVISYVLKFRDRIHMATQHLSEKEAEKKVSANLPAEPKASNEEVHIPRKKRKIEKSVKDQVTSFFKASLSVINNTNNSEQVKKEKSNVVQYILTYTTLLCNELEDELTKEADCGSDICMIGSTKYKSDQRTNRLKLPQCNNVHCPNATGLVITIGNNSEGHCLATGYLRDDFLTDISTRTSQNLSRWSGLFWLDMLPYTNGVVKGKEDYTFLFSNENTTKAAGDNEITELPQKYASIQLPLWKEPKPNNTQLQCARFENGLWNLSSCSKKREDPTKYIICSCLYPGFYSVFTVNDKHGTENVSSVTNQSVTVTTEETPTTVTVVSHPTVLVPTTTTATVVKNVTNTNVTTNVNNATITNVTTNVTNITTTNVNNITTSNVTTNVNNATTTNVTTNVKNATTTNVTTNVKNATTTNNVTIPVTPGSTNVSNATSNKDVVNVTNKTSNDSTTKTATTTEPVVTITATPTTNPSNNNQTQTTQVPIRTVHVSNIKYLGSFLINESYTEKVGKREKEFATSIMNQLNNSINLSVDAMMIQPDKEKIKVILQLEESKGHSIDVLKESLKNGTLILMGLDNETLNIYSQELQLAQAGKTVSSATTTFVSIIFVLLLLLIGSLITAVYLRTTREQRSLRVTQDLYQDPPAPKYLRLHDSVSLGSSGPSTPTNLDMESSLAVVTRPNRSRGYNTMEQFSNLPGNI